MEEAASNHVTSSSEEALPDKQYAHQYEYSPRKDRPPIIDARMYQILLNECREPCLWTVVPWHHCIRLDPGERHVTRIPKLKDKASLFKDKHKLAFGLEADYMLSLRVLVAYHLLAIIPAFAFWAFWMVRHPGDFQNASVPLLTVLSLITVFWIMAGRRWGVS